MIKKLYYLLTLLICSALWNPVGADAIWTFDQNAGLVFNADDNDPELCQFSCDFKAGMNGTSAEGSYANLIDGDNTTFFTSAWDGTAPQPDDHPHWLQVDLKDQPQQRIFFTMSMRYDSYGQTNRPTKFILYASNDAESWTQITEITDLPISMDVPDYISSMIDLGDTYRYLRFAVPSTNGGSYIGNYPYFAIGEFQVYQAIEATDPLSVLTQRFNALNSLKGNYIAGTDPGYYPEEKYNAFITAFDKADLVISQGQSDKAEATLEGLNSAYDDLLASEIDFKDGGYYYILSRYTVLETGQPDVQKAMYADETGLCWGNLNKNMGKFVFIVRKLEDGNYTIQNLGTGEYIRCVEDANGNFTDATDTQVKTSAEPDAEYEQILQNLGTGQWNIFNTKNTRAYNTQGHASGSGISGTICSWTNGAGGESAWSFQEITDQELIKSLSELGPKQALAEKMQTAITAANAARDKANDYAPLITSAEQISSNAQSSGDGSAYANLIDGSTSTIFHSVWDGSMGTFSTTTGTGWHNLQFNLGKEVSKMRFTFTGRDNSSGWHDNPTHITLYGTNDDNLGASTAAADSSQWTEIVDMTKQAYGFPGNDNLVSYESPIIDLNGSYKYLRFVVKHVSTMDGGNRATSFVVPEITGVTFNLSEFQVYDGTPTANSEYYKVSGMKEACDELDKLVAEAQAKISSLTVTEEDIAAINAIAEKVSGLYVDRSAFDSELAELKSEATSLYNTVTGARVALLTNASQFSTNNVSYTDSGTTPFHNLIDGDKGTLFHSYYSSDMQKSDITADDWAATLASVDASSLSYTGTGYHNLQVKLNEPVNSFYFEYYGRTGSDWHDNPNDIAIYATNDDELGASTDEAELSSWKEITELTEGFPEDVEVKDTPYTSPTIDLGDSYKYIRFVIKNTTHAGKVDSRIFNTPEVTGVTWNVSEFQMYTGLEKARIQYEYIAGMKDACDAMKALLDEAEKIGSLEMVTSEFNDKFAASIEAVRALVADTTEIAELCKQYQSVIDNSVVGTGLGFVDSEEAVAVFSAALAAATNGVDPISPTKEQVEAAKAQLSAAYKEFLSHIGQVEADKWYYLRSATVEGDEAPVTVLPARSVSGAALYITSDGSGFGTEEGDYHAGEQLRWGMDDVKGKETYADADAMWRFVAVPEEEYGADVYYIQNMRNASYIGNSNGATSPYDPYYSSSSTPMPFRLEIAGQGQFNIIAVGDANNPGPISAGDNARQIRGDKTNTTGVNKREAWTIEPVTDVTDCILMSYPNNSVQIVTLPFAVSALNLINDVEVHTYAIHSQKSASELALVEKDEIAAGEPFVMTVGDISAASNDNGKTELLFPVPTTEIVAVADTVNGLAGVINERPTISVNGYGYIENAVLKVLSNNDTYQVGALSGFVIPSMIEAQEGDYSIVLTTEGALGLKTISTEANAGKVNVYTVDGKLLKKNVKASEAQKNLKKGIYIIGKKKISIK